MTLWRVDDAQVRDVNSGRLLSELIGQSVQIVHRGTTSPADILDETQSPVPGAMLTVGPVYNIPRFWVDIEDPSGLYLDWLDPVSGARGGVEFEAVLRDAAIKAGAGVNDARVAAEAAAVSAAAAAAAAEAAATGPTQEMVNDAVAEVAVQLNVDRVITDASVSGTHLLDLAVGDVFVLTLSGNTTLEVAGLVPGRSFVVQVNQDMAGGHTLALPVNTLGDVTITPTANTFETLIFRSNTGTDLIAHQVVGGPNDLPFNPGSLTNQVAWYNADTVVGDEGSAISRWPNSFADRAIGTNTTANMPTLQITNGVPVLRFDGETDKMVTVDDTNVGANLITSLIAPGVTVAALVKITGSDAAIRYVFQGQDSNPIQLFVSSGAGRVWTLRANGVSVLGPVFASGWAVVVGVYNGASSKIRVNGTEVTGTVGGDTALALRVAGPSAGSCAAGDFAELILIAHAADAGEIADLETYLGNKLAVLEGA